MSNVEWLGQDQQLSVIPGLVVSNPCPEGWTPLPNGVCVRQSAGGWPEYQCASGYVNRGTATAPECVLPILPIGPSPASLRRGSLILPLVAVTIAAGILYAVVR